MTAQIPHINYEQIAAIFEKHERVQVDFSGGKDSIVLAHILERYKERFELVWVNTGAMFPHMEKFVREYGKRYRLVEVMGNQDERFKVAGLPAYVVPITYTPIGIHELKRRSSSVVINDWITCCVVVRSKPSFDHAKEASNTVILHGQREEDGGGYPHNEIRDGVELFGPIYDWTSTQVMAYIEQHGLELPEQYHYAGVKLADLKEEISSLECWNCTANLSVPRINYMRERYPELLEQLRPRIKAVYGAVLNEMERFWPAVINAMDGERI